MKGIDIDGLSEEKSTYEQVELKAKALLAGKTEEQYTFELIGIDFEDEDE